MKGTLSFIKINGFVGLGDITGHPAENIIKLAVNEHLVDVFQNGFYKPDQDLSRAELAKISRNRNLSSQNPTNSLISSQIKGLNAEITLWQSLDIKNHLQ